MWLAHEAVRVLRRVWTVRMHEIAYASSAFLQHHEPQE